MMKLPAFVIALIPIALPTQSAVATTMITDPNGFEAPFFPETDGTLFQVGTADLAVTALGIYDSDSNGLAQAYTVGLYTSSGTLLTSGEVPGGTSARLEDGSRWLDLTMTVTLTAGNQYVLAAYRPDTSDLFLQIETDQDATIDANVTLLQARVDISGPSLTFPADPDFGIAFLGPNLQYTVVPEGSSATLLIGALFAAGFFRGRKQMVEQGVGGQPASSPFG